MPELPEVQTIVNDLQKITSDTITGFWTDFPKAIKSENIGSKITNQKIKSVMRNGKNIIIEIANEKFIVIHLKMTGKLILTKLQPAAYKLEAVPKHLHHIFYLKKNGALEFHDIRKFATIEIISKTKLLEITAKKGVDPFSTEFTIEKFTELIERKKHKSIKSILMDQTVISGIGNIYASEIPFDSKINPHRKISSLSPAELKLLQKSILKILKKAIELRGTSFSDYRDGNDKKGGFQNFLKVYGKAGKKCVKCDTIIEKGTVEQRSTFHCPACQK
ncbi:MAG: hypothetical protein ACD_56C00013G0005 [uncultured bacterium]|nr:MAG: hypothetical protein ACD_56C00013G0005 [uncultured bacterium]